MLKKALIALALLLMPVAAAAQIVPAQNQILPSAYFGGGFLISTSTSATHKLGTALVDLAGSFITGILGVARGGTGSTTLGGLLSGNGASVYSSPTTTASCSGSTTCTAFTVIGS